MKTDELIKALGRLKVQTGSLACLGCGHEHNCGVHGCAIAREVAVRLSRNPARSADVKCIWRKASIRQGM